MTISLNEKGCEKNGISVGEVFLLLAIHHSPSVQGTLRKLIEKGYITAYGGKLPSGEWAVTNSGKETINSTIVDSETPDTLEDKLNKIAIKLKEIFPKGKKEGTSYYWADGVALITRRLKLFVKKYGDIYTEEQIINAATKYVESFNGNYQYMRLLKYFIFKEKVGVGGDIEGDSELITYIENAGQEENIKNEWEITLR